MKKFLTYTWGVIFFLQTFMLTMQYVVVPPILILFYDLSPSEAMTELGNVPGWFMSIYTILVIILLIDIFKTTKGD